MWPGQSYGAFGYTDIRDKRPDRSESRGRDRRRRGNDAETDKKDSRRETPKADKKTKKDGKDIKDSKDGRRADKDDGGRRDRDAGREDDRKRARDDGRDGRDGRRDRDRDRDADKERRTSDGGRNKESDRRKERGGDKEPEVKKMKKEEKVEKEEKPVEEPAKKSTNWREEVKEDEDERDLSDDEETVQRKMVEARRRREAIAAAAKKKKEEEEAAKSEEAATKDGEAATGDKSPATEGNAGAEPEKDPEDDIGLKTPDPLAEALLPPATDDKKGQKEKEEEEADGTSMFDMSAAAGKELRKGVSAASQNIGQTGASGHDWDDEEGYYIPKIGEVMAERYLVVETSSGKGVFSNVIKAKDQKDPAEIVVAVKILRANDMMTKAAEKEIQILEMLNKAAHPRRPSHIVKFIESFAYRKHFCLVFECMWDDLRQALKKYTKNKGMALQAMKAYTQQLFAGLKHMHGCKIVHADIKPDNILISKDHRIVKFCDLGTAVELKDISITPYLASRFYRAPEIILGCEYTQAVDTWALGCTLYELFTGKVLFRSGSNNDHLKKIMEYKGKIPVKVIKKGFVWKNHFSDEMDFKHVVDAGAIVGGVAGEAVIKIITNMTATKSIKDLILERVGKEKCQSETREDKDYVKKAIQFADLLEHMLALDPDKRTKPDEAFVHMFLQESKKPGEKKPDR